MHTTSLTLLEAVRAASGAPEWGRFVRLYRPLLEGWALRNGFQPADADELAQEILSTLLTALPGYERRPGSTFRGWLFGVARNAARNYRRKTAHHALPAADGLSGVAADTPFADMEEQDYLRELSRRALEAVRGDFSEQTMAAFAGTQVAGRPAAEVAAELGMTPGAVYLAVNRVKTRLRAELDGLID
ncbi:MAG: sigma-70 family RNA polymerase sigma factor [Gemmataceae bacterium]